jgi:MFS family permease
MTSETTHIAAEARDQTVPAVYAARALRDVGDGFIAVLLPLYLTKLGYSALEIGLIATISLFGSALMTLGIGWFGARIAARTLLLAAAGLMVATGIAFASASHAFAIVALIAFVGTINPSSGSVSIFVPIEHTVLSGATRDADRTAMFARYSLIGSAAAAIGALCAGSPDLLQRAGMNDVAALRVMFLVYAALGVIGAIAYARIPKRTALAATKTDTALGPSKRIVYKLAALFSLDSFAGGLVVQSLMALWLFKVHGLSLAAAGLFFFWTSLLAAGSFPVAAWLARRIGLVNTMVFTHIPSSLFLIAAALSPRLDVALGFLLARAALSQMDVPTRSSYVMAVVTPAERPAAASVTTVPRSLAAASAPALAGWMFDAGYLALPLILCGVIKIAYDLLLLWTFKDVTPPEERRS